MFYRLPPSCQIKVLDLLYLELFGERCDGTFVEIGAYDGETHSNTSMLADLGWRGLCIEPVSDYADRCRIRHQKNRVEVVNAAVAPEDGTITVAVSGPTSTAYSGAMPPQGEANRTITATAISPATLLERLGPGRLELLVLDCEGSEWPVAEAMDLGNAWSPEVIIVESRARNPAFDAETRAESAEGLEHLESRGWEIVWEDALNAVLARRDLLRRRGYGALEAAEAGHRLGDLDSARAAIDAAVAAAPEAGRRRYLQSRILDAAGDREAARESLERARDLEADRYYRHLARTRLRLGDARAAKHAFEAARTLAPDATETRLLQARLALARESAAAAAEIVESAVAGDPDHAEALDLLADLRRRRGDLGGALAAIRRAASLRPEVPTRFRLGRLLLEAGDPASARAELAAAVGHNPQNPAYRHALSQALERLGRTREAASEAEAAARLAGANEGLWLRLAELLSAAGLEESAMEALKEAIERLPRSTRLHLAHATRLEAGGRAEEARRVLLDAIRSGCGEPGLAEALARLCPGTDPG